MSRGVNKVILIGNLGADPEVRYMPSGGAVSSIRVATTEGWTDKETGNKQERTEWHRVVFFNKLAEIVGDEMHMLDSKGSGSSSQMPPAPPIESETSVSKGSGTFDDDIPF